MKDFFFADVSTVSVEAYDVFYKEELIGFIQVFGKRVIGVCLKGDTRVIYLKKRYGKSIKKHFKKIKKVFKKELK